MAVKIVQAKCPTCGANLPVPPGIPQVTCRYCQNIIHVEHRKPPPEVRPFGSPGVMPSRTLYVDPDAQKAGKAVGCIIALAVGIPVLLPLLIGLGPMALRSCKGAVKPFPIACGINEEIEVSGNFESAGPIVEKVNHNCKIHIKDSKLKGSSFLKGDASNVEITLENVQVQTTETMFKGQNFHLKAHNSTLTSDKNVFDGDSNLEIQELVGSTVESKNGYAIKSKYNLKVNAEASKIRGKAGGIDTDANLVLTLKKGSEVTSSEGIAIKTTSGFKLEAEGGKVEGPEGAIVATSGLDLDAKGLTIASNKETAIQVSSGTKIDLTDGSITSGGEAAVQGDGGEFNLVNTKVQGVEAALDMKNGFKLKATKKTRIFATTGTAVLVTSNSEIVVTDAAIESGGAAFKGTVNTKIKLGQGARMAGKRGGIETGHNFELDGTGATVDGGTGPGIQGAFNAKIIFKGGALKGVPAIVMDRKPERLELDGTQVSGEQKIPAR